MLLFAGVALALPPDPAVLEDRSLAGLRVSGCWEIEASVTQHMDLGILGAEQERYRFAGRLDDGRWTDITHESLEDGMPGAQLHFESDGSSLPFAPPLFGEFDGSENILDELVALLREPVELLDVTEEGDRVILHRTFKHTNRWPRSDRISGMRVTFADGVPVRWEGEIPHPIKLHPGRIRRIAFDLRQEHGAPDFEQIKGRLRLGPFTVSIERAIDYTTVISCDGEAAP